MRRTILIIEDVRDCAEPLALLLKAQGYRAAVAENGVEALGFLSVLNPDAVLLDLMMPVMNGFDFLSAVRAEHRWADLPVLAYTALGDAEAERRLSRLGVARYLKKAESDGEAVLSALRDVLGDDADAASSAH